MALLRPDGLCSDELHSFDEDRYTGERERQEE